MAQTKTIINKVSSVPGKVPLDTDLDIGEIAINANDVRIYTKKVDGTVVDVTAPRIGTTVERPVPAYVGEKFYDTDLGIPVWYNGTEWTNAIGETV